jgi:hypothetical protein
MVPNDDACIAFECFLKITYSVVKIREAKTSYRFNDIGYDETSAQYFGMGGS